MDENAIFGHWSMVPFVCSDGTNGMREAVAAGHHPGISR